MDDDLLAYYNEELAWLRHFAPIFSVAHPHIAAYLNSGLKNTQDPHIERLIEAFALHNANLHHQLDHEKTKLIQTLFDLIYPHYLKPIPSMSIVQFLLSSGTTIPEEIPQGSKLYSKRLDVGQDAASVSNRSVHIVHEDCELSGNTAQSPSAKSICTFNTCYPVTLWPIHVSHVHIVKERLQLTLTCDPHTDFQTLMPDTLRFYINAPDEHAATLYEWLMYRTKTITLSYTENALTPIKLARSCLRSVGFELHENILPYTAQTFVGYRLLTEFFNYPEKFLFFELTHLKEFLRNNIAQTTVLHFFFDFNEPPIGFSKMIKPYWFALGCTPIINLFEHIIEPFILDHTQSEYRLIPDKNCSQESMEIYTINKVIAIRNANDAVEYLPLYAKASETTFPFGGRWVTHRRPSSISNNGSDLFLTCLSQDTQLATLYIETHCSNRHLPHQLPFGGKEPQLSLSSNNAHCIADIQCLIPFTNARWPIQENSIHHQFTAHIINNENFFYKNEFHLKDLKNLLSLYSPQEIHGLLKLTCEPSFFCFSNTQQPIYIEGMQIMLEIDENKWSLKNNIFLFGCLLDRFFALSCRLNSFTQLIIRMHASGKKYQWPPRSGEKILQ